MRLDSLRGRTALVTGASSGIGRALALRLGREGARVALLARRGPELAEVAAGIEASGGDALPVPGDVEQPGVAAAARERIEEGFGAVDLLVLNAGYGRHRSFLDSDLADMERMMRVNYLGALRFAKEFLPGMVERRRGWLVFVASVAGRIGVPNEAAYAATKHAMVGLAEALSLELEDAGVHVLTVCPGTVRTPFFDAEALAGMPEAARRLMVEPEALAGAILAALRSGRRELTHPRALGVAYRIKALFPGLFRRGVRRSTRPRPD
jgi:short-subunit dehydrogenase